MPAPGDQHREWANPYEEKKPRISEWTAKEIATISVRLDKQLGPEYISSRAGPGGSRVHYLTAEKCIGLANEVFGFNGWSSSIQDIKVDFADENPQTQRVSIGLSVVVRVTLRDGTYHEDIGYGSIENARGKATAFEKAKKEGTTDALKRTLRNFGNVLGNCIYDQDYVKQVTKLKAQPFKKFDQDNLHRHSDFAKKDAPVTYAVPEETATVSTGPGSGPTTSASAVAVATPLKTEVSDSFEDFLGEFDEADFSVSDEVQPDEFRVPLPGPAPQTRQQAQQVPQQNRVPPHLHAANQRPAPQTPNQQQRGPGANFVAAPAVGPDVGEPVATFFSARAVTTDANQNPGILASKQQQLFNPKAESPSIRRTPGIDHNSSKPLTRSGKHVPPPSETATGPSGNTATSRAPNGGLQQQQQQQQQTGGGGGGAVKNHATHTSLENARRIGAPGSLASPLANRNMYKPPTMKRPLGPQGDMRNGVARTPLGDIVPNSAATVAGGGGGDGVDSKRQRMA